MKLLTWSFCVLRTWLGLGDASDDHPTPSHGWLLPTPEIAVEAEGTPAPAPTGSRAR